MQDTRDLEERIRDLEKSFRRLEEEWTEVYHKFRTLQMRVAKQVQRLDKESEDGHADEAEETVPSGADGLTPHQRTIQQQILERRRFQKGGQP